MDPTSDLGDVGPDIGPDVGPDVGPRGPCRAPTYASGCVTDLLTDATLAITGAATRTVPLPAGIRAVVVLVVDGLGRTQLDRHARVAPFLATAPGTTIDAAFPATTSTNLTSIGTGRTPVEHGIVGTSMAVPGGSRPLVTLSWVWDRQLGGPDARDDAVPERVQPVPTVFEQMAGRIRTVTVLHPDFATSGLTRAGLRGGEVVLARGLTETCRAAIQATHGPGPVVVYAHHGAVDRAGHLAGPGSDRWCTELATTDATLARVAARLPADVAMVVSADHGMVRVPDEGLVDLADEPDLLAGVRILCGEPRARQLHVLAGAERDVRDAWAGQLGADAEVLGREEALAAGWFGPPERLRATVADRIGDLLVVARTDVAWIHRDVDPLGGRLPGHHGAPTDEELRVPALVLTR